MFLLPLFKQFPPIVLPLGLSSLSLGRLTTVSKGFVKKVTSTKEMYHFITVYRLMAKTGKIQL